MTSGACRLALLHNGCGTAQQLGTLRQVSSCSRKGVGPSCTLSDVLRLRQWKAKKSRRRRCRFSRTRQAE